MEHEKAALRARFRSYRARLTVSDIAQRSAAICESLARLPEIQNARAVHAYWPIANEREVDIKPLILRLRGLGKQIVLPIVAFEATFPLLRHACFESEAALKPNKWGILEPVGGAMVGEEVMDVVLAPALGAGRNGHRIGYGKGFYDAFLGALRVPFICPVFAACLVDAAPAEAHDVLMDILVTEDEILRPHECRDETPSIRGAIAGPTPAAMPHLP